MLNGGRGGQGEISYYAAMGVCLYLYLGFYVFVYNVYFLICCCIAYHYAPGSPRLIAPQSCDFFLVAGFDVKPKVMYRGLFFWAAGAIQGTVRISHVSDAM